jgi:hypothetical protein
MTTRNENLDAITAVLEAAGVTYTIAWGKHPRVRWIAGGHKRRAIELLEHFAGERPLAVKAMSEH